MTSAASAAAAAASAAALASSSAALATSAASLSTISGGSMSSPQPPYVSAQNNQPFWPTVFPPPVQGLAIAYLTPHMAPVPVATRLPVPSKTEDTVNGFLRIEAAGGSVQKDGLLFDVGLILHSYAPNNMESLAELIMMRATAIAGNAQGQMITHASLQRPWYVTFSRIQGLALRQADPLVNLTRFKALVMWRVQGMTDPAPSDTDPIAEG